MPTEEALVKCEWCDQRVTAKPLKIAGVVRRRFLKLEGHLDIYPRRACEGGGRVFDCWDRKFLPREAHVEP